MPGATLEIWTLVALSISVPEALSLRTVMPVIGAVEDGFVNPLTSKVIVSPEVVLTPTLILMVVAVTV